MGAAEERLFNGRISEIVRTYICQQIYESAFLLKWGKLLLLLLLLAAASSAAPTAAAAAGRKTRGKGEAEAGNIRANPRPPTPPISKLRCLPQPPSISHWCNFPVGDLCDIKVRSCVPCRSEFLPNGCSRISQTFHRRRVTFINIETITRNN